ncbi:hypothetical protein [Paraburkholderia phenazinium]|nr:hypothetical protein [Paraburkholderia phenazinium]
MTPARSRENVTRTRSFFRRMKFATLIVALAAVVAVTAGTAGETNAFAVPVPGVDDGPFPTSILAPHSPHLPHLPRLSHPPRCALKYAAVLDLAELARRDGKSSSVYLHAFNNVAGQIDECNSGARYASASVAVVVADGGAGSAADE